MISFAKTLLFVLTTILLITCNTETIHYDWKPASFQTVKAYLLTSPELMIAAMSIGTTAGRPNDFFDKIKFEDGIELSEEQIEKIRGFFTTHEENSDYLPSDCFNPRHVIVYYNAQKEPVAVIAACFECGDLQTYPSSGKPLYHYLENFRPFFKELGMPVFNDPVEYATYLDSIRKAEKLKK